MYTWSDSASIGVQLMGGFVLIFFEVWAYEWGYVEVHLSNGGPFCGVWFYGFDLFGGVG